MNSEQKEKLDRQINKLTAQLQALRKRRRPRKPRVKSDRQRGRPKISDEKLYIARELAKKASIADVAFKLDISLQTMYRHGITRAKLDKEAAELAAAAGAVNGIRR